MKRKSMIMMLALMIGFAGVQQEYVRADAVLQRGTQEKQQSGSEGTEAAAGSILAVAPSGISKDSRGRMYMADCNYHVLRIRTGKGKYTVLAGQAGVSGCRNGSVKDALFNSPWDIAAFRNGWAVSDTNNHVIRYCNGEYVTTLAGSGESGLENGVKKKAQFNRPTGLAAGKNGELYAADTGSNVIRMIDKKGRVTVYAGSKKGCADGKAANARFNEPTGLYYYKGALYVADSGNHRICRIANGIVTTVAGSAKGAEGDVNGKALKARFSNPQDIIGYKDELYISDTGNGAVKKLSGGKVTTVKASFSMNNGQAPAEPRGITIQQGYLYTGDIFTEELLKIKLP